jgi:ketosteroid isomerase-like protein
VVYVRRNPCPPNEVRERLHACDLFGYVSESAKVNKMSSCTLDTKRKKRRPVHRRLFGCAVVNAVLCMLFALPSGRALFAEDEPPPPCASQAQHEFDFWIGDWDVFEVGSKVAHGRIDSILDGCVLREDYIANDGHEGQSFTIYDASRNLWHQTWVTSRGTLLEIEGKFESGQIVMTGTNAKKEIVRGTWKPINGEVREVAVKSADNGKTWEPWFDIMFRRAQQTQSKTGDTPDDQNNDKQTVAALDARYQEAVKQNDAAAMDQILADDFVLVTSSGKTYTKADLLEEAKSGQRAYEHQEDTDKTVRLWGDTAIVTAKLWEKGTENGKPFEHELWFSDVYHRTSTGWRYVFAQSAYRPAQSGP